MTNEYICSRCSVNGEKKCDHLTCSHGNPERCAYFQAAKAYFLQGDFEQAQEQLKQVE